MNARKELQTATKLLKQNYTIREAIDWYKNVYRVRLDLGDTLLETEAELLNSQFVVLMGRTSKKDRLPTEALAVLVGSVAVAELSDELMRDASE